MSPATTSSGDVPAASAVTPVVGLSPPLPPRAAKKKWAPYSSFGFFHQPRCRMRQDGWCLQAPGCTLCRCVCNTSRLAPRDLIFASPFILQSRKPTRPLQSARFGHPIMECTLPIGDSPSSYTWCPQRCAWLQCGWISKLGLPTALVCSLVTKHLKTHVAG